MTFSGFVVVFTLFLPEVSLAFFLFQDSNLTFNLNPDPTLAHGQ
jgi:hypothetical protein